MEDIFEDNLNAGMEYTIRTETDKPKTSMTLYDINAQMDILFDELEEHIDQETGELDKEVAEKLDKLFTSRMEKVSNIVLFIKNRGAFALQVDQEIKKLQQKKKSVENKVEWLKNYLYSNVEVGRKIETPNFTIGWRKSESIEVDPLLDLEELYKQNPEIVREKITYALDKIEAKKVYKATGVLPSGVSLVEKNNIQIK